MLSGKRTCLSLVVVALVAPAPASALPPLADTLEAARSHAHAVRSADARRDVARAQRDDARSRLLPGFTASASYARNQYEAAATVPDGAGGFRTGTFVATDQLDGTIGISVPLLDLSALSRLRARRAAVDASEAAFEAAWLEVAQQVVRAYFDLAAAETLVASAARAEEVARESARVLRVRLGAGLVSELEVARADAESERRAEVVASATLRVSSARRRLELLTGETLAAGVTTFTDDLAPPPVLESYLRRAELLPSVVAAEQTAEASRRDATAARLAWLPTLSATASERFTNAPGFGEQPTYQLQLRATMSLDLGLGARVRVARAVGAADAIEFERARLDAARVVADAHDGVVAALARLVASRAARTAAERGLAVAAAGRTAGTLTALELDQAERDAFDAANAAIEAEANVAAARALLELVAGGDP